MASGPNTLTPCLSAAVTYGLVPVCAKFMSSAYFPNKLTKSITQVVVSKNIKKVLAPWGRQVCWPREKTTWDISWLEEEKAHRWMLERACSARTSRRHQVSEDHRLHRWPWPFCVQIWRPVWDDHLVIRLCRTCRPEATFSCHYQDASEQTSTQLDLARRPANSGTEAFSLCI